MARLAKVDYDEENDILWIYSGAKAKDSLEIDKYVIDFSGNRIVGLEIFDASKVLAKITDNKVTKENLSNSIGGKLKTHRSKELLYIFFAVYYKIKSKREEYKASVSAPMVAVARN